MKESNGKKVTTLKVYKVIVIVLTVVNVAVILQTLYSWFTGAADSNYMLLASSVATYCATLAIYEDLKKKEAKKNKESQKAIESAEK